MKDIYNVVELFSGIGSQARALNNIGIKCNVQKTCEWDIHAFIAYDAIIKKNVDVLPEVDTLTKAGLLDKLEKYSISNDGKTPMRPGVLKTYPTDVLKRILSSIINTNNMVDITKVKGCDMPDDTDILTYSFPCQDLSNVGAFHGYNKGIDVDSGSRSSLVWEVGRILDEMRFCGLNLPRYLIMENVPTLLSPRHKANFDTWIEMLKNLGYVSKYVPVNARNYGIPQNRPRLLMMSVYVGNDGKRKRAVQNYFKHIGEDEEVILDEYMRSGHYKPVAMTDLFKTDYADHKFLEEALECTPNDTPSRRRIWEENPRYVLEDGRLSDEKFIRALTTKQDRNPNSGNLYFDSRIEGRAKFRYLTPRECMLFMGYTDEDYDRLVSNNPMVKKGVRFFSRDKIIRLAGNSIPVKMLEGFFCQLKRIEPMMNM